MGSPEENYDRRSIESMAENYIWYSSTLKKPMIPSLETWYGILLPEKKERPRGVYKYHQGHA